MHSGISTLRLMRFQSDLCFDRERACEEAGFNLCLVRYYRSMSRLVTAGSGRKNPHKTEHEENGKKGVAGDITT